MDLRGGEAGPAVRRLRAQAAMKKAPSLAAVMAMAGTKRAFGGSKGSLRKMSLVV